MHFIDLPYDIRHEIYRHLFPEVNQLYLQAVRGSLECIGPDDPIPAQLLRTCKFLNAEVGDYLYKRYLFNLIGTKKECIETHERFERVVTKYARQKPQLHGFSNGPHSSTMCLSLFVGEGKLAMLERRQRGQPKTIEELREEVRAADRLAGSIWAHREQTSARWRRAMAYEKAMSWVGTAIIVAVIGVTVHQLYQMLLISYLITAL